MSRTNKVVNKEFDPNPSLRIAVKKAVLFSDTLKIRSVTVESEV
jgi:hypothetical protein